MLPIDRPTAKDLAKESDRCCTAEEYQGRMRDLANMAAEVSLNARREGRTMTKEEEADAYLYFGEYDRIGKQSMLELTGYKQDPIHVEGEQPRALGTKFITRDGRELRALAPSERLADLPQPNNQRFAPLSLGRAIIGLSTGNWSQAHAEKLAISEGSNAAGGFLVTPAFATPIIDLARAQSAVIRAGASTLPWAAESDTMTMARVTKDPTFSIVAENATIPESSMTFGAVNFIAKKIGTIVSLSRELAEDAPNAAALIEATLAKALAVELDRMALVGIGNTELGGLLNRAGIGSTGTIGAIQWEDLHAAKIAIEKANYAANAYVCSPDIGGDLDILTSGDGTTLAKSWLGAPPSLAGISRCVSTNCPDANVFVGQFNQLVLAIRRNAQIEVSTQAGTAFERHQMLIKLVWRGDVNTLTDSAFHILKGITT
jgi:HK97 family phage major capsid protein